MDGGLAVHAMASDAASDARRDRVAPIVRAALRVGHPMGGVGVGPRVDRCDGLREPPVPPGRTATGAAGAQAGAATDRHQQQQHLLQRAEAELNAPQ
jgi:hypothetical protein